MKNNRISNLAEFRRWVKIRLVEKEISQNELARQMGIPHARISEATHGKQSGKYCIYLSVVEPDLKAVAMELKDQGEIKTYPEVVDIFEMSEITSIATEIMKLSGVIGSKKVTVVEEQKNS